MAASTRSPGGLSREERIGLAIAVALHGALITWLALDRLGKDIQPPPERMTVSFADAVALEAVSPLSIEQAAPDLAPTRGEPASEPLPVARAGPAPAPRSPTRPQERPVIAARPATGGSAARVPSASKPAGASRIGNDFLKGVGGEAKGTSQTPPSARAGPQVAASLRQAIARQLKPHWLAPQGAEADQLVTILRFSLRPDGSLAGRPQVVDQAGVTDANRAQLRRHAEQAIRAVQLAAPFDLPDMYYDSWKTVTSRFDRKLSQ